MTCQFCDCPKYGFHGNISLDELGYQVETILQNETVKKTNRFNVHFARIGEPTWNSDVITFANYHLRELVARYVDASTVHPVISTMLPAYNNRLDSFIRLWCETKNDIYSGEAGLQFSINSTDETQRAIQSGGKSLSLKRISDLADTLPMPIGRKYTLNFAVTADTILEEKVLSRLFDKDKFIVKITPIHKTSAAVKNGFDVTTEYTDYDVYRQFENPLVAAGWDVIVFVPSAEEDADRITCGNALIATR